ncbi:5-bromo-4-chloroindolyl phosphate hydrolysis family protein [Bacillus horti]|uniref:5-bromo-4-chloroindolyl phosphate hydrolysis protein n=1 Tax=Caldalkalibacillus horti TaxID=77523 RepID=A0ABT9VX99_9BACI|nr:5-bromo-4-chloroindolyl phosphate hydrolysis family protein [Bacillus horti]MDQ0165612.1 5-bromo-4-chloroindolyl phosphate hydrolysis protein [Bacillus horti]
MKYLYVLLRIAIAGSISSVTWMVLFFGMGFPFWVSVGYAALGGLGVFLLLQLIAHVIFLKRNGLTRTEYTYIKQNLREAKGKIKRIQRTFFQVRSFRSFRQTLAVNKLVRKIYVIVKREPKRFYQAERFFFYHLDSMVELTEKHSFLAAQAVDNSKIRNSLKETRSMIDQLIKTVEKDLYNVLSKDIDHLKFEIDVAKHSLSTWAPPQKERRSENEGAK